MTNIAEQVRVLAVSEKYHDYAADVVAQLRGAGLQVQTDNRDERLGYRIRSAIAANVPYLVVVGAKEAEAGTINVRCREGDDLGDTTVAALLHETTRAHR